jgi:hypothetical protein
MFAQHMIEGIDRVGNVLLPRCRYLHAHVSTSFSIEYTRNEVHSTVLKTNYVRQVLGHAASALHKTNVTVQSALHVQQHVQSHGTLC